MKETPEKPFWDKVGDVFAKLCSPIRHRREVRKIKKRLVEAIRHTASSGKKTFRSTNSIIMRFPQLKEGLQDAKHIFEKYDEDSNGTIDHEELKKCLRELNFNVDDKEINRLYHYCNMDLQNGLQYHEFIVLLCLVFLLDAAPSRANNTAKDESRELEGTFKLLVEAFAFLDKNGDGMLERKDFVVALNEAPSKEKSPTHIATKRFREMDWNKDGTVSIKEFLYSMIKWIGMDSDDEEKEETVKQIVIW
ncbi:probable calcium-binding protein CML21 isoform X1 [Zingiber officinale]|uniref:probable calcium-binding protein CML21 isoform X1 n=1 Tax=Zingiber officinale TaxID=94328 RepID=UPI001C4B7C7A|nr:probable calcium-binding protein CML21 isoform X1 [Zingiber officinale]